MFRSVTGVTFWRHITTMSSRLGCCQLRGTPVFGVRTARRKPIEPGGAL